jgi:hypothetical protein
LLAVFALFLGLGIGDVLGFQRRVPQLHDVRQVIVADSHLDTDDLEEYSQKTETASDPQLSLLGVDPNYRPGREGTLILTDPQQIQTILQIHQLLIDEGDCESSNGVRHPVTLHYTLTDGSSLTRYYYTREDSPAMQKLRQFTNSAAFLLGADSVAELLEGLAEMYVEGLDYVQPSWYETFAEALFLDAEAGNVGYLKGETQSWNVQLGYDYPDGSYRYLSVAITSRSKNTLEVIREYRSQMPAMT